MVWFGEIPYRMDEIAGHLARADLFVAIGTSGTVYPAAGFVAEARALLAGRPAIEQGDITVILDPQSAQSLEGAEVDFVSDANGTGFKFTNPQAEVHWDDPIAQRVQTVIDERIAPSLAGHGGWVELLEIDGDAAREVERYDMGQRIRALTEDKDGNLWVLEDERRDQGGRLLKLTP